MKKVRDGYKMTELGEIPNEWEVKIFRDISKVSQGLQIAIEERYKEFNEGRLPYITIQYINDKKNTDNQYFIENYNSSVVCNESDILMTRTGNTGIVVTNEVGVFHNNFFKVEFKRDLLNKDFLVFFLNTAFIQNLIARYAGTTTIPDLKHGDFYKLPVVIPAIAEQEKIASILSTVDEQIDNIDELIKKNKELKKGLMQKLLTKGIGHTKFKKTEIGDIPDKWIISKLLELAQIKRGASPRPINNPKWFSENKKVGWIRISDVTKTKKYLNETEQYLSEEGVAKSRLVKPNDLIMSICATVGKPIILRMEACIHDGFILFDNLERDRINVDYLYYVLQKKEEEFKSMGQPGTQINLNTNLVGSTLIALPEIEEQKEIVPILADMDKKIEEHENKKLKLEELKKGLMQQLLTGKIRAV